MTTELAKDNLKLLESGDFADVEITCQGRVWKVHSAILVGRSSWFKQALSGDWKEAQTRKINLDNVKPELMDILIKYIYTNDLPPVDTHLGLKPSLEYHVQLYIQADYLLLSRLKEKALKRLKSGFCAWSILCFHYMVVLQKNKAPYKATEIPWSAFVDRRILKDFRMAVTLAYSVLTARHLHKTLTAFAVCLRSRINIAVLEGLFKNIPEFSADFHKTITALLFDERFGKGVGLQGFQDKAQVLVQADECCKCHCKIEECTHFAISPLPDSNDKWCTGCSRKAYSDLIEKLIELMPLD